MSSQVRANTSESSSTRVRCASSSTGGGPTMSSGHSLDTCVTMAKRLSTDSDSSTLRRPFSTLASLTPNESTARASSRGSRRGGSSRARRALMWRLVSERTPRL
ncbi:hypothetical protein DSECCO2_504840 [anaerobic digester metagenome]